MKIVNISQARKQLSKLINAAQHGEEIIIVKSAKPVAKLVTYTKKPHKKPRRLGVLKGKIKISDDFDAPLSESILF